MKERERACNEVKMEREESRSEEERRRSREEEREMNYAELSELLLEVPS